MNRHLDPFAAPSDNRQNGASGVRNPHIMLQLRHVLFGGGFLRERPGQHELGLEYGATGINEAIQRRRHPFMDGVLNPPLHVLDGVSGIALVPTPVEVLGDLAEMNDLKFVPLTSVQIRAAQALVRSRAQDLARESSVGIATIRRAELAAEETSMTAANDLAVRGALEAAGVKFIVDNAGGPGVRLSNT